MLAELALEGATGHLSSLALGDVLEEHLGVVLSADDLLTELGANDIVRRAAGSKESALEQVRTVTESWRSSVQRELLSPPIPRAEANELAESLGSERLNLLVGTAGGGKSSVLEQTVAGLEASGGRVLAFRLDRLGSFASTLDLGQQLGLETSPAAALALAAGDAPAYLVIDQVDAVSLAPGRMPESFDVVADLIGEALSLSGVSVVLACRGFDVGEPPWISRSVLI